MKWKFHSTWEQRAACRDKWHRPQPYPTRTEAEEAAKDFNHYWRGTGTLHTVMEREGGWILSQGLL